MMNAFDQLDDEVLRELKECKKGKLAGQNWTTCKDLREKCAGQLRFN